MKMDQFFVMGMDKVQESFSSTPSSEMADGVPTPASTDSGGPDAVGMQCAYKTLYSGPEDKQGRLKWEDKIPDDLGKPAEDAESAKFALVVRYVKTFSDPKRVLSMHSILVQSPLLKKLLAKVLKSYPGVTTGLQRLEFTGNMEPLIHRWTELKDAISKETDPATREHAELFAGILEKEFKDTIDEVADLKVNLVSRFDLLWALFQPGSLIYSRRDGQDTAYRLVSAKYGRNRDGTPVFALTVNYVDWDGIKFGTSRVTLLIDQYTGTVPLRRLSSYPLEFHAKPDEVTEKLIERGGKFENLAGFHYKMYNGIAWKLNDYGQKDKHSVRGRIVIDASTWNKLNPNWAVYVQPFARTDTKPSDSKLPLYDSTRFDTFSGDGAADEFPVDGVFVEDDEQDKATKREPLTREQKLISTATLRGYSLQNKQWLNFFVNGVKDIEWSSGAFDSLVLESEQKELILGFTETQRTSKRFFDDVIEGKGRGIILLLCGPPGVGKTLTAEAVAEEMRVPLYMMSAGDLSIDAGAAEMKLTSILEMCTKWNAILLIDEADVFLEQRTLQDLSRNKLVSVFLRTLEYYRGIMFLTSNRVNTFDPAFQSRIHISLNYPELSAESRRTVWKNFLGSSASLPSSPNVIEHQISERDLDRLASVEINGRQIKNVLKTAQLLSSRREQKLDYSHIKTVLDVTQHLHNMTAETDHQRSAIFN